MLVSTCPDTSKYQNNSDSIFLFSFIPLALLIFVWIKLELRYLDEGKISNLSGLSPNFSGNLIKINQ